MSERNLRETKRRATAHALAQAAFDLAQERGVDGFTIDDVAARAGYSRRTFANHYAGKDEAIVGVALERVREALDTTPDDDLPLIDWLHAVARRQLSGGLLLVLRDLHALASSHPSLRPHVLEVQRSIREAARGAILDRVDGDEGRTYANLLVGAAYGALSSALDGHVPVSVLVTPSPGRVPAGEGEVSAGDATEQNATVDEADHDEADHDEADHDEADHDEADHGSEKEKPMTLEDFIELTFTRLRQGF